MTEQELLEKGKLVSAGGATGTTSATNESGNVNEAELLSKGKLVTPGGATAPQELAAASNPNAAPGILDQIGRFVGLRGRDVAEGVGQALDIGGAPLAYLLNQGSKLVGSQQRFNTPSQSMSQLATMAGAPTPATPGERIGSEATKAMVSTAAPLGLLSKVAAPVGSVAENVIGQLTQGPITQTVASGLGATAGQSATELGVNPIVSGVINAATTLGSNIAGQRMVNAGVGNYTEKGAKAMALNEAAKKEGVELTAGDLGSRVAQTIENFTQDLPGTGRDAFLRRQAEQTKAMLNRLDASLPDTKPGKDMIVNLRNEYNTNRTAATKLYDDVNTALIKVPNSQMIAADNFADKAKKFLAEYPKYLESPDVAESVKATLTAAKDGKLTSIPYQTARDIRTLIGGEAKAAARQGKSISGELDQLYKTLSTDFKSWANDLGKTNPDAAKAYDLADKFYKTNVTPYKNNAIFKKVVNPKAGEEELAMASDNIMASLFKPNKEATANVAMDLAGPGGPQIAQNELLNRALGAGLDDRTRAGVSPMRFVNTLDLQDPMVRSVMERSGAAGGNIQNINDIAQAARRGVSAFETPRTGVQDKALAAAVGLLNPATTLQTIGGLATGGIANYGLRSDPVKGLLAAQGGSRNPYAQAFPMLNLLNSQVGDVGVYDPVTGQQINRK